MLVCYCVCVLLMAIYWVLAAYLNRQKVSNDTDGEDLVDAFADQTDFQQKNFKYTT